MTDYISKINANSTDYIVGGDILDGQWVKSNYTILTNATLAGSSSFIYSLSSYLPNDSYNYEVLVSGKATTGSSSGNICQLEVFSGSSSASDYGWRLGRAVARTAANVDSGGCALVPIYSNDKNITIRTKDATTNNTYVDFKVVAYRRIGTNNDTLTNKISKITSNNTTRALGGKVADSGVTYFTTEQSGLYSKPDTDFVNYIETTTLTIAAGGTSTYSLSNIMPNDGYDYEFLFSVQSLVSTSGKYMSLTLGNVTNNNQYALIVGQRKARTNANYMNFQTLWCPIPSGNKNIQIDNTGNGSATFNIKVHGYRRIGTNGTTNTNLIKNINGYTIGGYNFDGEWTLSILKLMQSETLYAYSKVTYNLSSYLPNDGADYMVAFGGWGSTPSGSGECNYYLMGGTQTYNDTVKWGCRMMRTEYHSTSSYICSGNLMIPISASDRKVNIANGASNTTGSSGLYAIGYRRIGTNE